MSALVNLQEQLATAQAAIDSNAPNLFVSTPDSDGKEEVTIEQAK
jgi:hypothetical protein